MDDEKTLPHFLRYFIIPGEFRLRAGWRLLAHSILLLFLLMLFGSVTFIVMALMGLQPDDIFGGVSPLVDILVSLPTITATTFVARRVFDRKSFQSLGFDIDSHTLRDLGVGFVLPGLLMGGIFLFEIAMGWLEINEFVWANLNVGEWLPNLGIWFFVYIVVGFQEELMSRGYHLQNIAEGLNLPMGILISSSIFALLHLTNPSFSLLSFLGLLAAGLFLAYAWVRTRQLWLPIGLHIGWNFFEGNVFGFPVSGTDTFRLIETEVTGPVLITGGEFGPEAGLIVFPTLAIGTLIIYLITKRREEIKIS
jgi:membrane protease YdiL (CAAX protease family)